MIDASSPTASESEVVAGQETYSWAYGPFALWLMLGRTAQRFAGFLLPYLQPGMRLLDCGCGPGGITLGLADAVAPGEVVGIDLWPSYVETATSTAAERGVTNVSYRLGDVYELDFPDASFDAVFSANVLEHLSDPLKALKEMRRVLRPGGVIGVWDPDWTTLWATPPSALLEKSIDLLIRAREHNGSSPSYARHLRRYLLDAGFSRAEATAVVEAYGAPDQNAYFKAMSLFLSLPTIGGVIVEQGWAGRAEVEEMMAQWWAWGKRSDSLLVMVSITAVGWVPE
jgi:SAM-dependent methyltransferase